MTARPEVVALLTDFDVHGFGDSRAAVSRASNCRWVKPRVGDSAGTESRRTCSVGECPWSAAGAYHGPEVAAVGVDVRPSGRDVANLTAGRDQAGG
jgi:hypothetical protein